jgi:hypothetical protein
MPITISGSTGVSGVDGTASSPAVRGADTNTGVFYPAADQVAIATGGVQRLLVDASGNATLTGTLQVGGVAAAMYPLVLGTAVASTSGTSIDFTGVPSWVRRVTVMLSGVSTNGTSRYRFQLGSSAGVVTSGYTGSNSVFGTTTLSTNSQTAGFDILSDAAANTHDGLIQFVLLNPTTNIWVGTGGFARGNSNVTYITSGSITLPGALDRVRLTTLSGTDTFDAGSINILYE